MSSVTVDLLTPHGLRRWVLPLGFVGLGLLFAIPMALPPDVRSTVFMIARLGFLAGYLALVAVGMSRKRRTATITADASGIHEGGAVVIPREAIRQVLSSRTAKHTTIEVRGARPIAIEVSSPADADALLATLDPGRETATISFLATTTPTAYVVLAWMGIPALLSFPLQLLLMHGVDRAGLATYAAPSIVFWLGMTWWFMRRRRVTLSTTEIALPRLLASTDQVISLGELTAVIVTATFHVELRFASRRPRRLKIYDPALIADLVARLQRRAHIEVVVRPT